MSTFGTFSAILVATVEGSFKCQAFRIPFVGCHGFFHPRFLFKLYRKYLAKIKTCVIASCCRPSSSSSFLIIASEIAPYRAGM